MHKSMKAFLKVFVMNLNLANVFDFVRCCYISALLLTCFHLTKARATYLRPETIAASFLHLTMLLFKVFLYFRK